MRIETLGQPRLLLDDREVGPEHEVVFAVVMTLLEATPRPLTRQGLCELLWPDATREKASHNLRQAAYRLKQFGLPLDVRGEELSLPAGFTCDLHERLAADGALADLALRWGFLEGYEPRVSNAYAVRIERWRERVQRRLIEQLMQGLRQTRMRTQWMRAVAYSQAILDMDPLNEEATLTLAEGRALQGSKAEAVALLDRYLEEIDGKPGELAIQPTLLKRRITERMPAVVRDRSGWKLLVGRDALLESYANHMRRARSLEGTIGALWGEPGVGKTRMVREMNALAAVEGWSLVTISCEPTWPDRPLCALEVMTSTMLLQPGALGVDPKAHRALQRLTRMDPADEPLPQGPEDSAYRQRLLRTSVLDLIDAVSSERPLLIAVDDAQWLDPTSVPFFSMSVEHSHNRRVAWLFTAHEREQLPKMATGSSRALVSRVNPLTEDESFELLGALVHGQPPADRPELLRRAASVSNGNPLYVHTLATHWLSTGDLSELPPSLEALIEQRLDTTTVTGMRCLQVCALLGRHATVGRVEAVMQVERHALLEAMDQLHAAGLLETQGDAPLVRHGIIASRSVGRASKATVVLLHRYIAEVLEPVAREGKDAGVLVACARHLRFANLEQRGIQLIEDTVRQLLRAGSVASAWEVIREMSEDSSREELGYRALAVRLSVEIAHADGDRASTALHARALIAISSESSALADLKRIGETMLIWASLTADSPSRDLVRETHRLASVTPMSDAMQPLLVWSGIVLADQSFSWSHMRSFSNMTESRRADATSGREAWLRTDMIAAYYRRDEKLATEYARERIENLRALGSPFPLAVALQDLTVVLRSFGHNEETRRVFTELSSLIHETGATRTERRVLGAQVHFHLDLDELAEAERSLGRLEHSAAQHAHEDLDSFVSLTRARLYIQRERIPELLATHGASSYLEASVPENPRSAANVWATRVAVRLSSSDDMISESDFSRLLSSAYMARGWPRTDFIATYAALGIERNRGRARARRFLERLIERRFENSQLSPELSAARRRLHE